MAAVERLAGALGRPVPGDEHGRWELYRAAAGRPEAHAALREALAVEPDRHVLLSAVLVMVELVPDGEHGGWVALAPGARRRAAEVRLLRRGDALSAAEVAAGLPEWSDWLQLRLAESLTRPDALEALKVGGRTRRVRNAAGRRR